MTNDTTPDLIAHIESNDRTRAESFLRELSPTETVWTLSRLDESDRSALMSLLSAPEAAEVLRDLPDEQVADLLEDVSTETAATIVGEMAPHDQADVLAEIDSREAEAILDAMPADDERVVRQLMEYPEDCAGGLMDTRFLAYPATSSVAEVLDDLRRNVDKYTDFDVQYVYVTSKKGRLIGVLRLRDILMTKPSTTVEDIMIAEPVSVPVLTPLDKLGELFSQHASFLGVPVVDDDGILVGVLLRSAVQEAEGEAATDLFLKLSGVVGGEEFRSMPLPQRSIKRLSWLGPNILLNMMAASVIAFFQDTLQTVIALAVFLPIISDMSGCSGNQSVAVSIRELSLGLVRPTEFARVFFKEVGIGLINGAALGLALGTAAYLWQGNPYLGLVVGVALAANTLISVLLGGLVPLFLRSLKVDPALASGPLLTTVTDMCGFLLALGLATTALPYVAS